MRRTFLSVPFIATVWLLTCLCAEHAFAQYPTDAGGVPVPKSLDQGKIDRPLREKYKDDFASRDPSVRGALAHKLRETADGEADSTTKFVYLREARELAVGAGDMPYAMDVIDDMGATFAIDLSEMKASALSAAVDQARIPPGELAQNYLKVADSALLVWDLDLAHKAAYLAEKVGRGDAELMAAAKERDKISHVRTHLVLQFVDARKKLEKNPDDPQLNQFVGIHLCFNLNHWDTGLSYLAKSALGSLKALADKDLAGPTEAAAMAALADGWWDLSEPKAGLPAGCGHRRAAYWYQKALPGLTGDKKAEAEKRIADANADPAKP